MFNPKEISPKKNAKILKNIEWQVPFLAGYAETDFIESPYKIKLGKTYRIEKRVVV